VAVDAPVPLATWAQLSEGPFADLVSGYTSPQAQNDLMVEATRRCEDETQRRLAPFTAVTESHRATGVDPDEYAGSNGGVPMSIQGTLGQSYANALGYDDAMVRHCWLNEYAPRYAEMWAYSNVSVAFILSVGGGQSSTQVVGPEPDSGHVWFQLGTFLPVGSWINVTYSGGYTTVPAGLVRACKLMAASLAARELDPMQMDARKDPDALQEAAGEALRPFMRDGGQASHAARAARWGK
jgi:hypothetical protein